MIDEDLYPNICELLKIPIRVFHIYNCVVLAAHLIIHKTTTLQEKKRPKLNSLTACKFWDAEDLFTPRQFTKYQAEEHFIAMLGKYTA